MLGKKTHSMNKGSLWSLPIPLGGPEIGQDEMARQRHQAMRNLRNVEADDVYLSHDDPYIDFSSAGLYLVGLQTTVATVACAATSVASCWLLPVAAISAVRTLAITSAIGFICMRKPIRIGKVRGVVTLFNALRPCVAIYISVLVVEQLVHTCVDEGSTRPGMTRHVVFHVMMTIITMSGFVRAYKPYSETDAPFLVTSAALVIVALLPPPATPLSGPLCEGASLWAAGERLLRAFLFSALYVIHVYCSPPYRNAIHDLAVCIMRCAAAAVWVLGCHIFVVWLGAIQAMVALWARFGHENALPTTNYSSVDTRSDSGLSDAELGIPPPPVLSSGNTLVTASNYGGYSGYGAYGGYGGQAFDNGYDDYKKSEVRAPTPEGSSSGTAGSDGVPVDASQLALIAQQAKGQGVSKARLAEIAASM